MSTHQKEKKTFALRDRAIIIMWSDRWTWIFWMYMKMQWIWKSCQFTDILSRAVSVAAPNAISHHTIDCVRNFIMPQIKFAFGVHTPLQKRLTLFSELQLILCETRDLVHQKNVLLNDKIRLSWHEKLSFNLSVIVCVIHGTGQTGPENCSILALGWHSFFFLD